MSSRLPNHTFRSSDESTASGSKKDSCLLCGKTEEAHSQGKPKNAPVAMTIKILWQGKTYEFTNEEEARKRGFHLG